MFKVAHSRPDGIWDWCFQAKELDILGGDVYLATEGDRYGEITINSDNQVIYISVTEWEISACAPTNEAGVATFNLTTSGFPTEAQFAIAGSGLAAGAWACPPPAEHIMTAIGNGKYTLTLDIPQTFQYKYLVDKTGDGSNWEWYSGKNYVMPLSLVANDTTLSSDFSMLPKNKLNTSEQGKTYAVTAIGSYAFSHMSYVRSITIPNTVTHIEYCAFYGTSSLITVSIPNSVTYIGYEAFVGTGIYNNESNWENGVLYIDDCLIKAKHDLIEESYSVKINTRLIANLAFSDCHKLTSITLPSSVTYINNAFDSFNSLTHVTLSFNSIEDVCQSKANASLVRNNIYCPRSIVISNKELSDLIVPNTVDSITDYAFYKCKQFTSITLPSNIKRIGHAAFSTCSSLTSINIPNSVLHIEDLAFENCTSLTAITVPEGVQGIGYGVFENCTSLKSLSLPNSAEFSSETAIYTIALCVNLQQLTTPASLFDSSEDEYHWVSNNISYWKNSLDSLVITSGELPRLGWDFIEWNQKTLKTIDLAATTNTSIAEKAFYDCYKLEKLSLPAQLEYIPYMSVAECVKLRAITIPATVTEIEDRAFENCRTLKSVIFEGSEAPQGAAHYAPATGSALWRIGSWAFYNCHQLEHLNIPEGVTEVGDAAFYGCTYLVDMTLPSTVQEIGDNGFALCAKLQKIHVKATTPPAIQAKTFFDVNRRIPVYVPEEAVDAYKSDLYWQEFDIQGESNAPAAVSDIHYPITDIRKEFRDGQFIIIRDGVEYNAQGTTL